MVRKTIDVIAEILLTCGLILALFIAFEMYGKQRYVDENFRIQSQQLERQWSAQTGPESAEKTLPGKALARLYIPAIHGTWVVVQGVNLRDITVAPGHYPTTQMPGEQGNFAVAGHRSPGLFWDLDKVKAGNTIVVETRTTWYVYNVYRQIIVRPDDSSILNSPEDMEQTQSHSIITLTTCNPKWDNYQRLIVQGELVKHQDKAAGKPTELTG